MSLWIEKINLRNCNFLRMVKKLGRMITIVEQGPNISLIIMIYRGFVMKITWSSLSSCGGSFIFRDKNTL